MSRIIEYSDGFLFEVEDDGLGSTRLAVGDGLPEKVAKSFEMALEKQVKPAAMKLVEAMKNLNAEQVELELGVKMVGELGAVFAKGSADAHMVIKITWKARDAR